MKIIISQKPQPLFKGHKELLDTVKTDFYTGKEVPREKRSTEHIKPKSLEGDNFITNYAMTDKKINNMRGNMPITDWLKIHPNFLRNIRKYIGIYWDLNIDGIRYGRAIQETLRSLGVNV